MEEGLAGARSISPTARVSLDSPRPARRGHRRSLYRSLSLLAGVDKEQEGGAEAAAAAEARERAAVKQAFYNAAANVFVLLALLALVAVFFVLEIFLRPLLWATLTGSFLYPFKKKATNFVLQWLNSIRRSGTPLFIGLLLVPFQLLNFSADVVGSIIARKLTIIVSALLIAPLLFLVIRYSPLMLLFSFLIWTGNLLLAVHGSFSALWLRFISPYFWSLVLAYLTVALFMASRDNEDTVSKMTMPIWGVVCYQVLVHSSGPVFTVAVVVTALLLLGYAIKLQKSHHVASVSISEPAESKPDNHAQTLGFPEELTAKEEGSDESSDVPDTPIEKSFEVPFEAAVIKYAHLAREYASAVFQYQQPNQDSILADASKSNRTIPDYCFYGLFWAIVLIGTLRNLWIIWLLAVPLALFVLKRIVLLTGIDGYVSSFLCNHNVKSNVELWRRVLLPSELSFLLRLYLEGDKKLVELLKHSVSMVMSVGMVALLFLGSLLLSMMLAVQIQSEAMGVVEIGTNLATEMAASYPQLQTMLPNSTEMQATLTSVVERAYGQSRDLLEQHVSSVISGDEAKSKELTGQLLAIYDQVYLQLWLQPGLNHTEHKGLIDQLNASKLLSQDGMWSMVQTHGLDTLYSAYDIALGNFDTLKSIAASVWLILRSNVTLIANLVTSLLWILLSSGSQILNFIISFIVFLTALFYLLSLSNDRYKPMEIVGSVLPTLTGDVSQNAFADSVNNAIKGVFGASLKLAAFYGLYTWTTHTIFGVRLVFLPAVIAASLGAVPVFGTYLAVLPGIFELWLLQGQPALAIVLLLLHLLPTYGGFDTAVYAEISGGGHPYLTGLAVVGGIYLRGAEGAILGPILLCLLIVVSNMYSSVIVAGQETSRNHHQSLTEEEPSHSR